MSAPERKPAAGVAWRLGAMLQGLVLGVAVAIALFNLLEVASGAQIFRYQGF